MADWENKDVIKRFRQWKPYPDKGKLPLKWSLWIEIFKKGNHKSGTSKNQFESALQNVGSFSTMNKFCKLWATYTDDQGKPIKDCNILIFHEGITPAWEEPENIIGGHFVVRIMRNNLKAEQVWFTLLMTVLCNQLPGVNHNEINGIVISPRDYLAQIYVWNKHSLNSKYKELMESFICDSLDVPKQWMRYNTHKHKVYANSHSKKKGKNNNKKNKKKNYNKEQDNQDNNNTNEEEKVNDNDEIKNENENEDYNKEEIVENIEEIKNEQIDEETNDNNINNEEENSHYDNKETKNISRSIDISNNNQNITKNNTQKQQTGSINLFSISVGLAIFLALLYNLYILFG